MKYFHFYLVVSIIYIYTLLYILDFLCYFDCFFMIMFPLIMSVLWSVCIFLRKNNKKNRIFNILVYNDHTLVQKYDPSNSWGKYCCFTNKNVSFLIFIERRNRKFVFVKIKKLVDSENYYLVGGLCIIMYYIPTYMNHAAQSTI